jgi:hypothetical protein
MLFFIYAIVGMQVCIYNLFFSPRGYTIPQHSTQMIAWCSKIAFDYSTPFLFFYRYVWQCPVIGAVLSMHPLFCWSLQCFGTIHLDRATEINDNAHFQAFPQALFVLFR